MSDPFVLFAPDVFLRGALGWLGLTLPGLVWTLRFPYRSEDVISQLARLVAFSLAWNAILAEVLAFIPWRVNGLAAQLFATAILIIVLRPPLPRRPSLRDMTGLAAIAALIAWRFFQVRDVILPPWVDPVHHTLIVRQIMTQHRVPLSIPVAPQITVPFYYHFGFHLNAALAGWLGRLSPVQATFLTGTVLNAAVPISLYALSQSIWHSRRRAWITLALSGLVMHMPAYYAAWGRYTLLTGMTIASGLLSLAARARQQRTPLAEMTVLTGGLLLSHYFAGLVALLGLAWLITLDLWNHRQEALHSWSKPFTAMVVGTGLALPWLARMWTYMQHYVALALPGQKGNAASFARQPAYLWQLLSPAGDHVLYLLALPAIFWAVRSRQSRPWALWSLTLLALGLPWSPSLRPFRPDHFVIVLFAPTALLLGDLSHNIARFPLHGWKRSVRTTAFGVLAITFIVYGVQHGQRIVPPSVVFVTPADVEAIRWADVHLPDNAHIMVNAAPWQAGIYRGLDGGWWLLPLTGRATFPPPTLITYASPSLVRRVAEDAGTLSQLTTCDSAFWNVVQRQGITHLYLRAGTGSLQADTLQNCNGLAPIYAQQGVTILAIRQSP